MKNSMKKFISMFLICIMSMILMVGCGNSNDAAVDSKVSDGVDAGETKNSESEVDNTDDISDEEAAKGDGAVVLYIVRHGKTMLNTTDRVQGWSDAVLTKAGEVVVGHAGAGLAKSNIKFDAVYSSDSGRSIQTADIILEKLGQQDLQVHTDWRLREFNFGTYEGDLNHTMWTDIAESMGMTLEEWQAEGVIPREFANSVAKLDKGRDESGLNWEAEDYETITKRLKEGLDAITAEVSSQGGGNVLLVSHGLSIGAMVDILAGSYEVPAGGLKNASVTIVEFKDDTYTVKTVGDVSYTEAGEQQ